MRTLLAALLFSVAASPLPTNALPIPGNDELTAILHTEMGDVTIRFLTRRAPNHVKNFVNLASDGFYDGTLFHRVIPGFVLQGGDPLTKDRDNALTWGNGGQIDAAGRKISLQPEFNDTPHKRGVVSMARSAAPDSASSQFFIVLKDYPSLDHKYTAFGEVVNGMDVVDRIVAASNADSSNANLGKPRSYISLTTIDIRRNGQTLSRPQSRHDIETPPSPTPGASASDTSGTGFLVSSQGDVLTNRHVVVGCRSIRAGKWVATVVAQNDNSDLALLRIPFSEGTPHATFRDSPPIRPGDSVTAIGYPLPGLLAPEQNISTGTVSALAGPNNDRRILQVSAPIQPGNSGGPLLDSSAHVVGVMVSTLSTVRLANATGAIPQNVNFAIRTATIREFLDQAGVTYLAAASKSNMSQADVAARARSYVMPVSCERIAPVESAENRRPYAQTLETMRQLAVGVERFAVDYNHYPTDADILSLIRTLEPYLKKGGAFSRDAWGGGLRYAVDGSHAHYRIVSGGARGRIDSESLEFDHEPLGATTDLTKDIIFGDGQFLQYPAFAKGPVNVPTPK